MNKTGENVIGAYHGEVTCLKEDSVLCFNLDAARQHLGVGVADRGCEY